MTLDKNWLTEVSKAQHAAFSMEVSEKCHEEQAPFGKISIYDSPYFGKIMLIDDCIMLTTRDNFIYHEMMSHPVLLSHPNPQDVIIVGGGDCGTLKEVLKHDSVTQATQIEIEERVTRLSEQYFPELCTSNDDPRARLVFKDAIEWIKNAPSNTADVIIIDSTDPIGPAENLFKVEFYAECRRVLRNDGILSAQSESPLYHLDLIQGMSTSLKDAGFLDTHSYQFPQPSYPSGWWSATMATKRSIHVNKPRHVEASTLDTRYYNAAMHEHAFALPEFMRKAL